jgi:hypothetical protein
MVGHDPASVCTRRGHFLVGVENLGLDEVSAFSEIAVYPRIALVAEVVVPPRSLRHALQARLAEHFELVLTSVGVLVAISLTFAQLDQGTKGLALTFLVWLQGFLIWAARRHSRLARTRLIQKLRVMLQDRVNNQLTVLVGVAELHSSEVQRGGEDVETALSAARAVSRELEGLSLESLRTWEAQYARHLPQPLR